MSESQAPQPQQAAPATPSSHWRQSGEADPHQGRYDVERAALTMGNLTDDELANGAFLNYNRPLDIAAVMAQKPGYHPPIAWMTAVKDRIRWLSRSLEKALAATPPQGVPADEDAALASELAENCVPIPISADQALGMLKVSWMWLSVHAPDRLKTAAPPQQAPAPQPVGLTDEQIAEMWSPHPGGDVRRPVLGLRKVLHFARAVIAEFCRINDIQQPDCEQEKTR